MFKIKTNSEEATRELGCRLGKLLLPGSWVALHGDLGSGKTRFTQGIGRGLGIPENTIVSPTYTLCVPYPGRLPLVHVDAYRIGDLTEVDELGLDEWLEEGAVLVVEWPEKIAPCLPANGIHVFLTIDSDGGRTIAIDAPPDFRERMNDSMLF